MNFGELIGLLNLTLQDDKRQLDLHWSMVRTIAYFSLSNGMRDLKKEGITSPADLFLLPSEYRKKQKDLKNAKPMSYEDALAIFERLDNGNKER